jgi:hypothetical protein
LPLGEKLRMGIIPIKSEKWLETHHIKHLLLTNSKNELKIVTGFHYD